MFLLDTNTLIYFFREQGRVATHLLASTPSRVSIPAIAAFEIEAGIARSTEPAKRLKQWRALTATVQVIPFGVEEAQAAAMVQASLLRAGTPIGPLDTLIAGTALAHNAVLVTRNTREFSRVPGLKLEDWY